MFSALISFLGGTAFRFFFGEIVSFFNKRVDHAHEVELLKLQNAEAALQHERNQQAIRQQAELQVKVVAVQGESNVNEILARAWETASAATTKTIGIKWVDAWNAVIRPGTATWAIVMMTLEGFALLSLDEGVREICGAALGLYLADRSLMKRGK